jgi:hypothetical protein
MGPAVIMTVPGDIDPEVVVGGHASIMPAVKLRDAVLHGPGVLWCEFMVIDSC